MASKDMQNKNYTPRGQQAVNSGNRALARGQAMARRTRSRARGSSATTSSSLYEMMTMKPMKPRKPLHGPGSGSGSRAHRGETNY